MKNSKVTFNQIPVDKIAEMLRNMKSGDGLLIIMTNGVEDVNNPHKFPTETFQVLLNPATIVQGLFSHATQLSDYDEVDKLCGHLIGIGNCTRDNVDIYLRDIQGKTQQN